MKSLAAARVSSSIVSIRFLVSGPVFSIVWPPLPSALHLSTPRGPSRTSCRWNSGSLRVVAVLRLFLGVEVVEVAEELVEAVHRRQVLVAVALVVLAELAGGVALALQHRGHGDVGLLPAFLGAGQADLGHAGAHRHVAADEGRAAGGAALLAVVVGEGHAFAGDAVDVRRLVAHHAAVVVADVPGADVVAPDDEDVGFSFRRLRQPGRANGCAANKQDEARSECVHFSSFWY